MQQDALLTSYIAIKQKKHINQPLVSRDVWV